MTAFMFQPHKFLSLKGEDRFSSSAAVRSWTGPLQTFAPLFTTPHLFFFFFSTIHPLICASTLSLKTKQIIYNWPARQECGEQGLQCTAFQYFFSLSSQIVPDFHFSLNRVRDSQPCSSHSLWWVTKNTNALDKPPFLPIIDHFFCLFFPDKTHFSWGEAGCWPIRVCDCSTYCTTTVLFATFGSQTLVKGMCNIYKLLLLQNCKWQ